jgi:hypothetical protein
MVTAIVGVVALTSLLVWGPRLLYSNLVHLGCMKDARLIKNAPGPIPVQASSPMWRLLESIDARFGNASTALCLVQHMMLEGRRPYSPSVTRDDRLSTRDEREGPGLTLPTVSAAARAVAAGMGERASDAVNLYLEVLSQRGFLPFAWMYDAYSQSVRSLPDSDSNTRTNQLIYQSVNDESKCIALDRDQVGWGLPIALEQLTPGPCLERESTGSMFAAENSVYNLLPNGGLEWPSPQSSDTSKAREWDKAVYEGDDTRGTISEANGGTVLLLANDEAMSRMGASTRKLRIEPGMTYMLGATVFSAGGHPYLGVTCWLGDRGLWTWYAINGSLSQTDKAVSLFDVYQIPADALDCYASALNVDSTAAVWFDDMFLVPVQ